jgi:hypothetical protein
MPVLNDIVSTIRARTDRHDGVSRGAIAAVGDGTLARGPIGEKMEAGRGLPQLLNDGRVQAEPADSGG